jgi:hypothetical protein
MSVYAIRGCTHVLVINKNKMKKSTDDPRMRHLQRDPKMEGLIRLENCFETIHEADTADLKHIHVSIWNTKLSKFG